MDAHIRALRKEELLTKHGGAFDEENAERIISWLVAAENRSPVVLVGAGFTLNARDRRTGKQATQTQAPLWSEVVAALAKDLGVSAERYDAPTMFEMYKEHLKEAKFRDALRATVADSDLTPGAAHEALIAYPSEAIVTTNCLDTLLDKACDSRWRRIVTDQDLSTGAEGRDLIYLHGHRDFSDSWVMTRSQYEDVPRQKPVIVARVRQLLAQHPWLVVGFGMTDPNFHSITRLLGSEMRGHQPLSLALTRNTPSAAERLHWNRLGFEIASPTSKDGFAEFLAWLLPKLVTTYSPTSTAAKGYIRRGSTPTDKLQRFRDVHTAPIIDREEAYEDWKEQLRELLSADEQSAAMAKVNEAHQAMWTRSQSPKIESNAPVSEVAVMGRLAPPLGDRIFDGLDLASNFRPLASFEEVQWLSTLLSKSAPDDLAEHFAWALTHQIFEDRADHLPREIFAIRLATRAGWKASNSDRLNAILRAALASARKYGREKIEELVKAEAVALQLPLASPEDAAEAPHIQLAQAGHQALMNASFEEAADRYAEAAKLVGQIGLVFEEWVYVTGEADALSRLAAQTSFVNTVMSTSTTPEAEKRRLRRDALRDRIAELENRSGVEHWISRADQQSRAVLQEVVERSAERERFRSRGNWGKRFSGNGHALWKSFRDLETVYAPPSLRRTYLEPLMPLLNAGHLKLVLPNARKCREWLDGILDRPVGTLAERQDRDKALNEVLIAEDMLTKSEIVARVECLCECNDIFRKDDVPKVLKWLEDSALRVSERWGDTAWGSQAIAQEYWPAFSAAARWAKASAACATASLLVERLGEAFPTAEEAIKALYELPWHVWKPLAGATATQFLATLTRLLPATPVTNVRVAAVTGHALFALVRMLRAGLTGEALTSRVDTWKALLAAAKESKAYGFGECKRAGFLVERELAKTQEAGAQSAAALFEEWFGADFSGARGQHEEAWATLVDAIDDCSALLSRMEAAVDVLISEEKYLCHYALNPHLSYQAVTLLTKGMKYLPDQRSKIGPFLRRLLAVAPNYIGSIAESINREWWESKAWSELMDLLLAASGGGLAKSGAEDVGFVTRRQLAVLDLFGRLQPSSLVSSGRSVWYSMQGLALSAVADERVLVANHAAFAIVTVAERVEDADDAQLYASAIRRIGGDPRVPIRSAVADAGPRLAERARTDEVRRAAGEAIAALEGDDNAQVNALCARAKAALACGEPRSG